MDSYFDVKALPNPEITQSAVLAHLMQQLHKALPAFEGRLGLAFPAYGQQHTLGGIIRILGEEIDVVDLHQQLQGMMDVTDNGLLTAMASIPEGNKYVRYTRVHVKGNSRMQRLKRRHEAAGTWTDELAAAIEAKYSRPMHLPHVGLRSASSGQRFLLFVQRANASELFAGLFNAYGLSLGEASVPSF